MRLGLIGGGFKPFTTGHYALLSKAIADCDRVIVFYGLAGRQKGSGYNYTREMSLEVYDIVSKAIERSYPGKVHVMIGKPTPIVNIFQAIEEIKNGMSNHNVLGSLGIDPSDVTDVSFYSSPEDLLSLERHLGTPKEAKYYGDLYQSGRLHLVPVDSSGEDLAELMSALRHAYPNFSDEDLADIMRMRGSTFRSFISSRDEVQIKRYLPSFLTDAEKNQIVEILLKGLVTTENLFRQYIQATLRENR